MSKRIRKILIFLTLLLSLFITASALANAPEGKGDGTGGGELYGLSLTGIKVESQRIELEFSKNVTNLMVKENNIKSISVEDSNNKKLNIEVEVPDDQLEREKRRDIYINLSEPLEPDEEYILKVEKGFMAKNGETLKEDIEKKFVLGTEEKSQAELKVVEEVEDKSFLHKNMDKVLFGIFAMSLIIMFIVKRIGYKNEN